MLFFGFRVGKICLFLAVIALMPRIAMAKKNRKTRHPTLSPSTDPTKNPTKTPTRSPSRFPGGEPRTASPTLSPTSKPTVKPTINPTVVPMTISTTTTPTDSPSSALTVSPINTEKNEPTQSPSIGKVENTTVVLPRIRIDIILSDSDASSLEVDDLDSKLASFLEEVLVKNSGAGTFDSASFDFEVIRSTLNRRRLDAEFGVTIDGTAYFEGLAPSEDDLYRSLRTYLTNSGIQDLETYLRGRGLPSAIIAAMSVNGNLINAIDQDVDAGAKNQQKKTFGDSSVFTPSILAGLVAGFLALIFIISFSVSRTRKVDNVVGSDRERLKNYISSEVFENHEPRSHLEAPPSPNPIQNSSRYSDDESVYTSNTPLPALKQRNPSSYDPTRLDRVIQAAKQHASNASA